MILQLPEKFDENEWLVLIGFIVTLTIFLKLPRHFPPAMSFIILLSTMNLSITTDYILAASKDFYNFYDAMDTKKFDLFDFILTNFIYGLIGYLFIYFYDKYQFSGFKRVLYFLFWMTLSLSLEFLCIKLNVIKFINWNLYLSAISYLVIFFFYIAILKITKLAFNQIKKAM